MLKKILDPNLYHGENKQNNYFEGWYFKLVPPTNDYVIVFIPGISKSSTPHSFIQVLEGHNSTFHYVKYHINEFYSEKAQFSINIGKSSFSLSCFELDICTPDLNISGHIKLLNNITWPDSILNPGSMGFYNYLSFMQCYSQVCSMNSDLQGSLKINGKNIDFNGGKAYIEKNWGKDFPYSYVWCQCNTFYEKNISFTCSLGHIPLYFTSFTGFLAALVIDDKFYKFTSINGSKIEIHSGEQDTFIQLINKLYKLDLYVSAPANSFMNLFAPRNNKMIPIARESLRGELNFHLSNKKDNTVVYEANGINSGLEFSGDYKALNTK